MTLSEAHAIALEAQAAVKSFTEVLLRLSNALEPSNQLFGARLQERDIFYTRQRQLEQELEVNQRNTCEGSDASVKKNDGLASGLEWQAQDLKIAPEELHGAREQHGLSVDSERQQTEIEQERNELEQQKQGLQQPGQVLLEQCHDMEADRPPDKNTQLCPRSTPDHCQFHAPRDEGTRRQQSGRQIEPCSPGAVSDASLPPSQPQVRIKCVPETFIAQWPGDPFGFELDAAGEPPTGGGDGVSRRWQLVGAEGSNNLNEGPAGAGHTRTLHVAHQLGKADAAQRAQVDALGVEAGQADVEAALAAAQAAWSLREQELTQEYAAQLHVVWAENKALQEDLQSALSYRRTSQQLRSSNQALLQKVEELKQQLQAAPATGGLQQQPTAAPPRPVCVSVATSPSRLEPLTPAAGCLADGCDVHGSGPQGTATAASLGMRPEPGAAMQPVAGAADGAGAHPQAQPADAPIGTAQQHVEAQGRQLGLGHKQWQHQGQGRGEDAGIAAADLACALEASALRELQLASERNRLAARYREARHLCREARQLARHWQSAYWGLVAAYEGPEAVRGGRCTATAGGPAASASLAARPGPYATHGGGRADDAVAPAGAEEAVAWSDGVHEAARGRRNDGPAASTEAGGRAVELGWDGAAPPGGGSSAPRSVMQPPGSARIIKTEDMVPGTAGAVPGPVMARPHGSWDGGLGPPADEHQPLGRSGLESLMSAVTAAVALSEAGGDLSGPYGGASAARHAGNPPRALPHLALRPVGTPGSGRITRHPYRHHDDNGGGDDPTARGNRVEPVGTVVGYRGPVLAVDTTDAVAVQGCGVDSGLGLSEDEELDLTQEPTDGDGGRSRGGDGQGGSGEGCPGEGRGDGKYGAAANGHQHSHQQQQEGQGHPHQQQQCQQDDGARRDVREAAVRDQRICISHPPELGSLGGDRLGRGGDGAGGLVGRACRSNSFDCGHADAAARAVLTADLMGKVLVDGEAEYGAAGWDLAANEAVWRAGRGGEGLGGSNAKPKLTGGEDKGAVGGGWLNKRSRSCERFDGGDVSSADDVVDSRTSGCGVAKGHGGMNGKATRPQPSSGRLLDKVGQSLGRHMVQQQLPFSKRQRPPAPGPEQHRRQRQNLSQLWHLEQDRSAVTGEPAAAGASSRARPGRALPPWQVGGEGRADGCGGPESKLGSGDFAAPPPAKRKALGIVDASAGLLPAGAPPKAGNMARRLPRAPWQTSESAADAAEGVAVAADGASGCAAGAGGQVVAALNGAAPAGGRVEPGYKYSAVVRSRAEREGLQAVECAGCKAFYDAVATWGDSLAPRCNHHRDGAATGRGAAAGGGAFGPGPAVAAAAVGQEGPSLASALRQAGGRHRFKFAPPATPEGFWDIGFGDTQD